MFIKRYSKLAGFGPRFEIFSKLTLGSFILLFLLGYQPMFQLPLIRLAKVSAEEQESHIIASAMPILQLPHPGYLSTPFSSYHKGIDLATGLGMPIHPITEGFVEDVNFGFVGYGNHVIVIHGNGLKSLYGHMARVYVKKGQPVNKDDTLGTVGMTGFTSGPHTHLEITQEGKYLDPVTVLPEMQKYPSAEYLTPVETNNPKVIIVEVKPTIAPSVPTLTLTLPEPHVVTSTILKPLF